MARISIAHIGEIYRITVKGRLAAGDLQRLERACGSALHEKIVPLELDIRRVTSLDETAHLYLEKLRARGARIPSDRLLSQAAKH
jgi:hypothetical protein